MILRVLLFSLLLTSSALAVPAPKSRPDALKVVPTPEAKPEALQSPKAKGEKIKSKEKTDKKATGKPKATDVMDAEQKPGDTKPSAIQPDEIEPAAIKPGDTKSAEPKAKEALPSDNKSGEPAKPEAKPVDAKPVDPDKPAPEPDTAEVSEPLTEPVPDAVCDEIEKTGEFEFERLPRISEGQCGALTPIRLKAVVPKDGQRVTFQSPVTVTCQVAAATLVWLQTAVQPAAAKHLGGPITEFLQTGGYECRGRNRVVGAKMSEHGIANALDIGAFKRTIGAPIPVNDQGEAEAAFLAEIRKNACGPFTTVLGPGVAAHETHFHLDLAKRGKDGHTTYCR